MRTCYFVSLAVLRDVVERCSRRINENLHGRISVGEVKIDDGAAFAISTAGLRQGLKEGNSGEWPIDSDRSTIGNYNAILDERCLVGGVTEEVYSVIRFMYIPFQRSSWEEYLLVEHMQNRK
jgi:hypothetical protein